MKLPVNFPSEREKLATEALEVREYTASERVRVAFELSAMTAGILAGSPTQARQTELLARHARDTQASGTS